MDARETALICGVTGVALGFFMGLTGLIISIVVGVIVYAVLSKDNSEASLSGLMMSLVGGVLGWMIWAAICLL